MLITNKLKKRYKEKDSIIEKIVPCILVVTVLLLSMGWATFNQTLEIDGAKAVVRIQADIRITGLSISNDNNFNTNKATSNWEEYNVKHLLASIDLPEKNSQIKYKIQITNFGNAEMGILNITGLPEYLEYKLENYELKNKICVDDRVTDQCKLGIQKDIYIIIKYKDDIELPTDTDFTIDLDFDFRPFHKITYVDFDDGYTSSYPNEIIDGGTFKMTLKQPYPVGAKPFIGGVGIAYQYAGDTLVVENITTDLEIRSNYISAIEDLVALSVKANTGNSYEGKTVYLEKNLDFNNRNSYRNADRTDFGNYNNDTITANLFNELTNKDGYGFVTIGAGTNNDIVNRFNGNFDGQNHTINNIYIKALNHHAGFFGLVGKAGSTNEISNFTLTGQISKEGTGSGHLGGIIASSSAADIKIENVHSSVNLVNYSTMGGIMGGIIGYANGNLYINNCTNHGEIKNTYYTYTGGLVGWSDYNSDRLTEIYNSHNYGAVIIDNNSSSGYLGGLIASSSQRLIVNNSHNEGKLTTTQTHFVGGLAAEAKNNVCIMNSYNIGEISTNNSLYVGGIVTNTTSNIFIINSYNSGNITGLNTGGIFYTGSGSPNIFLDNIFNSGDLVGTNNYEVFYSSSHESITVNNVYYKEENLTASNVTNINLISKKASEMQSNDFVTILNNNINSINKDELKARLLSANLIDDSFQLNFSKWKLGKNGYPTLDIE